MMYPDKNNEKIVVPRHPRREFIHKLSLYLKHAEQPATIRHFRLIINVVLKPNAMDDSKLVVIRSFSSVGEASIYKSLLESSGVPCELLNELTAEVLPIRNEMMPGPAGRQRGGRPPGRRDPRGEVRSGRIR